MPPFYFKKFSITHDNSSMKVGTDGVLLGAWTDCKSKAQILDIGTGCGLIALMLAQRTTQNTIIDAIDIDKNSVEEANKNFKNSPWPERLKAFEIKLQDFYNDNKYDLIVCNPPFFINSEKSPIKARYLARHTEALPHEELLDGIVRLLAENGKTSIILPVQEGELFTAMAMAYGLSLNRLCEVIPRPGKDTERLMMEFSWKRATTMHTEKLILELEKRHQYSKEYEDLTKDFYLFF